MEIRSHSAATRPTARGLMNHQRGNTLPMDGDRRLQPLVDQGAIDELLNTVSLDQVTETWLRYHSRPSHREDPADARTVGP